MIVAQEIDLKIIVEAHWDEDAGVWSAASVGNFGLVTEAESIEELQRKLAVMVPDLLADDHAGPFDIELIARSHQTIAA